MKPIRDAIEALQAKSLCPRLHIDVTHADAVCPDFVRDKWKEQLVIDLDPSYPLELAFTEVGVEANLSFGGYVTRCVFPWEAIYVVGDRATGRGQVIAGNVPASLRARFGVPPELDRELTKVRDDSNAKSPSRRRKRRGESSSEAEPSQPEKVGAKPGARLGLVSVPDEVEAEDQGEVEQQAASEAASKPEPTPEAVQGRRSAFKVIDGG